MSDLSNEAESLVNDIFGINTVNDRFRASDKMSGVSDVMVHMAKETQTTYDLAALLLNKQFSLNVSKSQQALREHIINITDGVNVELKESELLSLTQATGRSAEDLLKEYPNLKIENQSSNNVISCLSDKDSRFLLESILCHSNVAQTLSALGIESNELDLSMLSTKVCMAVVKTLYKVRDDVDKKFDVNQIVALLHFVVVRNDDLGNQQLNAFTKLVSSFFENKEEKTVKPPENKEPLGDPEDVLPEEDKIKLYLSNEDDAFVRVTIRDCKSLAQECKTLNVVLTTPIDFDSIGLDKVSKLQTLALQQRNMNKNIPEYAKLEQLLTKVVTQMQA